MVAELTKQTALRALRYMMPHGVVRSFDWAARFRRIGAPSAMALRGAMRDAMLMSRIEFLPFKSGSQLGLVVDVGANIGAWSDSIRHFLRAKRHVAIEPNPELHPSLQRMRDRHSGVELICCALGESASTMSLNVTRGSALASLLRPTIKQSEWHGTDAEIVTRHLVQVRTLDDVIGDVPKVDLLKLDVQGFERQVIAGGAKVLAKTSCLLVEFDFERLYDGDVSYRELADIVERELGFAFWDLSPAERRDGRALWADACFVRPAMAEQSVN